jgi:hypothetical protein
MTEKQFVQLTANMHAQSVYQQQMIGHLVGLVHGLVQIVAEVGKHSGMDSEELLRKFAGATRAMNHTLAEIPFPEFQWPEKGSQTDEGSRPSATPPAP